jgi:DNA-binding transcriptional LysR family regulator
LQFFVAVAEELSFTRASRRLHVVQSGVSSAIQGLERELGAVLFDRDRHRVALTDAGMALLPEARATLAAAQAAMDAVGEARAGLRGTLTVGTMLSTGDINVPDLLGRFHRTHPDVAVRLRQASSGSAGLARLVLTGELDLALLGLPGQPPPGLRLREVSEEPLVIVCPPGHPLADEQTVTLARLASEQFVDFPPGWGNRTAVDRAFLTQGIDRQVAFEVPDYTAAEGLVANGLGVSFIPASAAARMTGLRTVSVADCQLTWRVSLATPATRRLSAAARAFVAELGSAEPAGQAN